MGAIGTRKLLELVKEHGLVKDLSERELINPEGTGFDLRVGKMFRIIGSGELLIETRKTSELELISDSEGDIVELLAGNAYLMETVEEVNMPADMVGIVKPRTTLFRSGVMLRSGTVSPGYSGKLFFMLTVHAKPFKLQIGARVAHIMFFNIEGGLIREYEGQWQGGRATVTNHEKQI